MLRAPLPTLLLATSILFAHVSALRAEILVKSGEKIAFLGDSITSGGWSKPNGYVKLVMAGLEANGVQAEAIPAGISGHKSNQMLARLQKDVIDKQPQWMTLSCGVNDVWHGKTGVPLDDAMAEDGTYRPADKGKVGTYQKNITALLDQVQKAGIKPVILTATVIQEDLENDLNKKLAAYNDFLRSQAKERKAPLADLNAMFQERIRQENKPGQKVITGDGVHMNAEGDKLMALGVLKAFGLNEAQLKKATDAWALIKPAPPRPRATPAAPAPAAAESAPAAR